MHIARTLHGSPAPCGQLSCILTGVYETSVQLEQTSLPASSTDPLKKVLSAPKLSEEYMQ